MSKIIKQTFRRFDDHSSFLKINLQDDVSERRNQYFSVLIVDHINIIAAGFNDAAEDPRFPSLLLFLHGAQGVDSGNIRLQRSEADTLQEQKPPAR